MSNWWTKRLGAPSAPPSTGQRIDPRLLPRSVPGNDFGRPVQHTTNDGTVILPSGDDPNSAFVDLDAWEQTRTQHIRPGSPHGVGDEVPLWQWKGNRLGGAGETMLTGNCPRCGSARYFSRRSESKINVNTGVMAAPRGECMDCGYPQDQGMIGSGVHLSGSGQHARQAARDSVPVPTGTIGKMFKE